MSISISFICNLAVLFGAEILTNDTIAEPYAQDKTGEAGVGVVGGGGAAGDGVGAPFTLRLPSLGITGSVRDMVFLEGKQHVDIPDL